MSGSRLLTKPFIALSLADLAYFTSLGVMIPLVPLLAVGPLGAGPAGAGLAVGAFAVAALLLRPVAGRLADVRGRRPVLLTGGLLFTVVSAAHLLAEHLLVLVLLRVLLGVAEALFFVASMAVLADLSPKDRLGEAISYNSLSLYLGIVLGPAIGELLLATGNYRLAFLGAALLALVATLLALRIPETGRPDRQTASLPLIDRAVLGPGLAFFSGLAGLGGFLALGALHTRDVGIGGSGVVLGVFGTVVIVGRIALAKASNRLPPLHLGAMALVLCGLGQATLSLVRNPAGVVAGATILGLGITLLTPAFYRAVLANVPPALHGRGAGTFSVFVDLGLGGGPLLLGAVASLAGIPGAFAAASVLAVAGALGAGLLQRAHR